MPSQMDWCPSQGDRFPCEILVPFLSFCRPIWPFVFCHKFHKALSEQTDTSVLLLGPLDTRAIKQKCASFLKIALPSLICSVIITENELKHQFILFHLISILFIGLDNYLKKNWSYPLCNRADEKKLLEPNGWNHCWHWSQVVREATIENPRIKKWGNFPCSFCINSHHPIRVGMVTLH